MSAVFKEVRERVQDLLELPDVGAGTRLMALRGAAP